MQSHRKMKLVKMEYRPLTLEVASASPPPRRKVRGDCNKAVILKNLFIVNTSSKFLARKTKRDYPLALTLLLKIFGGEN